MTKKDIFIKILRIIFGSLLVYVIYGIVLFLLLWAYETQLIGNKSAVPNWILTIVLCLLLYFYMYGIIGYWMIETSDDVSLIKRIIGRFIGGIGVVLRPFVLKLYGENKKWILLLTTALPLLILGVVLIYLSRTQPETMATALPIPNEWNGDWTNFFTIAGATALFNVFLILRIKKCKKCKCIITEIDYEYVSSHDEKYSRHYTEKVGSITSEYKKVADVYQNYDVNYNGKRHKFQKVYFCTNCGHEVKGHTFSTLTMDEDDPDF